MTTFGLPPAPNVPIEQGSARAVSPVWYSFFVNLFKTVGSGQAPISLGQLITDFINQRLALTVPSFLTVAGSPVGGLTGINGTLAVGSATGAANQVLATPNGAGGTLSIRALVAGDLSGITAGGDLSGTYPNPVVAKINTVALGSTTATAGNVLIGSGTAWVTNALSGDATLTSGGVLTIANNAITTAKINNAAVTYAKIQNESTVTLLGNPTGAPAAPSEVTLGATLAFSGAALQTGAITGDATASANSFATTVVAISGQSVTPGSWTPADGSGAALVFTSVNANYTRLGNMVFAYGTVTYPATVDATQAVISGLPFTAANQTYAIVPFLITNGGGVFATEGVVGQNTTHFSIFNPVTAAVVTNAQLSGVLLRWMAIYPVA